MRAALASWSRQLRAVRGAALSLCVVLAASASALAAKADALLAVILCIPLPPTAGDCYARVKIARQQGGLSLDENDLWIAATALAINATLVSRDHDFRRIEGLRVEDWTEAVRREIPGDATHLEAAIAVSRKARCAGRASLPASRGSAGASPSRWTPDRF